MANDKNQDTEKQPDDGDAPKSSAADNKSQTKPKTTRQKTTKSVVPETANAGATKARASKTSPSKKATKAPENDSQNQPAQQRPEPKSNIPPQPSAPAKSGSGFVTFLWLVLFLAALIGGGWATQPLWMPYLIAQLPISEPDPTFDPRIRDLEGKVASLQTELKTVQQTPMDGDALADLVASRAAIQADVDQMMARMTALETRLNDLQQMAAATTIPAEAASANADITILNDRLESLGEDVAALSGLMQRVAELEAEGRKPDGTVMIDGRDLADIIDELQGRVGDSESRNAELASRLGAVETRDADLAGRLGAVESRDVDLVDRLDAVENRDIDFVGRLAAVESRDGSLEGRIGALESRDSGQIANQAMVLVIGQVRSAIATGRPFDTEVQSLRAVAMSEPSVEDALATLERLAPQGVPTMETLMMDFRATSKAIVAADRELKGEGWVESTVNQLSSLVTVRKIDPTEADGVDQIVANVDRLLTAGDLSGAVDTLSALEGKPAEVAKPWAGEAQLRLDAEKALASLHVRAVAGLATPAAASSSDVKE